MVKRRIYFWLTLALVEFTLVGCSASWINTDNTLRGSGKSATETRSLANISAVSVNTSGHLTVIKGENESLTIVADDNLLANLTSEVSGGRLVLGSQGSISTVVPIVYRLTVPRLNGFEVNGSGDIVAHDFDFGNLSVKIAGSGDINLMGQANQQDIYIAGSGNYRAEQLPSQSARATIAGSGSIFLRVGESLDVDIGGSGNVYYTGQPTINQRINGSGRVIQQ
jgi:hypothetical protein